MSMQEHEQRLIGLETKIAYQEDSLRTLNDIVVKQREQIERLNSICRQLVERATSAAGAIKGAAIEEVPPHY